MPEVFFGAVSAHKNQMMKFMNRLLLVLIVLGMANFAAAQIRPDLAPLEENPDTSNFEVYSQKNGNLRRATLMGIGKYVLENLSLSYDSNNNQIVISEFGTASDTITLENVDITASLSSDDTLSINDTDIYLGSYDNSLTFDSGTKTLFLDRRGTNNFVSLASLTPSLSLSGTTLSYGSTDISLSAFNQTLSLNSSTDILSISNASGGGGASTVDLSEYQNLSAVSTVSYFGGDGTSGSPLELNDASVPVSKLGTISTARLLGRYSSGTGGVQPIIIGSGLNLSASGELSATGGSTETVAEISNGAQIMVVRYVGVAAPVLAGSSGSYEVTVPSGTVLKSFRLHDPTGSTYTDGSGNIDLVFTWTGVSFNTGYTDGLLPDISLVTTSNGNQLINADSGYQISHSAPAAGATTTTITGINSLSAWMIIGTF